MRAFKWLRGCRCGVDASDHLHDEVRDQAASVEFVESVDSLELSLAR